MMTPYQIAERYIGIREIAGDQDHPLIQWWLSLCDYGLDAKDEIPWCSAFMQHPSWELRLPRSKSAAARSWLQVGTPIDLLEARQGADLVVIKQKKTDPGADVLKFRGHVGWFSSIVGAKVFLLGGNQSDGVCIQSFSDALILGVRRLPM